MVLVFYLIMVLTESRSITKVVSIHPEGMTVRNVKIIHLTVVILKK